MCSGPAHVTGKALRGDGMGKVCRGGRGAAAGAAGGGRREAGGGTRSEADSLVAPEAPGRGAARVSVLRLPTPRGKGGRGEEGSIRGSRWEWEDRERPSFAGRAALGFLPLDLLLREYIYYEFTFTERSPCAPGSPVIALYLYRLPSA